jgi:hypothetical protein
VARGTRSVPVMPDLAAIALALPDVETGLACAGTSLESRTFATAGKVFLFVGTKEARLKLAASAGEARNLGFPPGATGWVKLPLDALPGAAVLRRWIGESRETAAGTAGSKGSGRAAAKASAKVGRPKAPRSKRA